MKRILTIISLSLCVIAMNAQTNNVTRKKSQKQSSMQTTTAPKKQGITMAPTKKQSTTTFSSQRSSSSSNSSSTSSPTIGTSSYISNVKTFIASGVSFQMVEVRGGCFRMGGTSEQGHEAEDNEIPTHNVTLNSYYIGRTEVTQELWQAVMGSNPSNFKGSSKPVECVSWNDCKSFISKLNSITGKKFRMPTEAEWEFAARGGTKSKGYKYSGSNTLDNVAWYTDLYRHIHDSSYSSQTHEVGTKSSNELGIFDMSGNVYEWCSDWYGDYSNRAQTNPTGPNSGSYRVSRGGSWNGSAKGCRLSYRNHCAPDYRYSYLGLRLCLSE